LAPRRASTSTSTSSIQIQMPAAPDFACPCGRAVPRLLPYLACCGRWHAGPDAPPDAESLMRARYSAYVLRLHDYVLATWHAPTRPADLGPDEPGLQWLGLEVRRAWSTDEAEAWVEFVARSRLGGRAHRLHETSRFVREQGRWWYVDGVMKLRT
jgi:SEC-C motif-containing protein